MSVSTQVSVSLTGAFTPEAFEAHLTRIAHLPAWWMERKRAAYARFARLPLPRRTDENWRFSNQAGFTLDGYALPGRETYDRASALTAWENAFGLFGRVLGGVGGPSS